MGTSKSSSGSPSGAPLVPPWVPKELQTEPTSPKKGQNQNNAETEARKTPLNQKLNTTSPNAPEGRFRATRGQLGRFARNGDSSELRRGVGSYARSGLGGKKQASRRFMGSANVAGALYQVLTDLSNSNGSGALDKEVLTGKAAVEIIDSIVDATRSLDGTQDAETCRASINDALVELFEIHPDADLLNLNDLEKSIVIERFIASEIFRRFILDVGSSIRNKAQNATIAARRLKEAKEYIRETVVFSLKKIKSSGKKLGSSNVRSISKELLEESFSVFEDYI